MINIVINGSAYEVMPGKSLLQTCLSLGFNIPYFCFHPALGSVGACRQCAVKKFANADDKTGKIIMSCMEPVTDGLIISTDDPEVVRFRAAVIESLMTNHPHDCPVCDEGGECHLQDMTVMTGHAYRRFVFKKRTYKNQYLGPFIQHEMNRCIQCYRCVRFYREYAGGNDLDVFGSANRVYFGRGKEGILENEFSGNLVEVCPTGVFTDKTLKDHYTRKWDLTNAPSVCVHCSLGCNTIVSERYGSVRRVLSRYNNAVNGYFICDRGRFGYEFLNSPGRIKRVMVRSSKDRNLEELTSDSLPPVLIDAIRDRKIAGIGSPRASLESNFMLVKLVGKDNFYHGISASGFNLTENAIRILKNSSVHTASLKDVEKSDAILILGEDPVQTAPMLSLAVRQAVRNRSIETARIAGIPEWNDAPVRELAQKTRSPLFIATPFSSKLDSLATTRFNGAPSEISRFGFAVAAILDDKAPALDDIDKSTDLIARKIAKAMSEAENPLIITGLHSYDESLLNAVSNILVSLSKHGKKPSVSIIFPECNSVGLSLMGGKPFDNLITELKNKNVDAVIVLENDLYQRNLKESVDYLMDNCKFIIVLDHLMNETAGKADFVLPVGAYAESTGTIVNNEGRAQRYYRVLPENDQTMDSWRILSEIMGNSGLKQKDILNSFDDIVTSLTETYPSLYKIKHDIPDSSFRILNSRVPRQSARYSGRTAISASINISEPKPPADIDSPLAFSMEGYQGVPSFSGFVPFYWSPGWNSVQAMNKYMDEPGGSGVGEYSGVPLFGNTDESICEYSNVIPETFKKEKQKFLIVQAHLTFGSEELSSESQSISVLIPEPFILLNEKEINNLRKSENDLIKLIINQINIKVIIKKDDNVPDGVAGLSMIARKTPYLNLPDWGIISGIDQL